MMAPSKPLTRSAFLLAFSSFRVLLKLGVMLVLGFISLLGIVPVTVGIVAQACSRRTIPDWVMWTIVVPLSVAMWWFAGSSLFNIKIGGMPEPAWLRALSILLGCWFATFGTAVVRTYREWRQRSV